MNRYQSYKDSGVVWIGEIPNSWIVKKISHIFSEKSSTKNPFLNCGSISFGEVVYKNDDSIPEITKSSYQEVLVGEFLINPLNLNYDLKSLRISMSNIDVVVSQGYIILKNKSTNNSKYLKYLLRDFDIRHIKSLGNGVRQTISFKHLSTEKLPLPSLSEQTQIVSYLDRKTEGIDKLIQTKVRKIELLKEYRTSLISKVVTKGLNPNVKMKDSGVEWIGEIPEHWEIKKMFLLFRPSSVKNTINEVNLSVYRDYGVIPRDSRDDNHNIVSEDISNYKLVEVGDFVMNKMKCWMGSLGLSQYRGIVSPSYTVMKPLTLEDSKFLHYLLRSNIYISQYEKYSYGVRIGQWELRFEDFRELKCVLPPLSEQTQIVSYLDEQTQLIDKNIQTEEKKIELLKEYRQSLISEVVTGKIKVSNDEEVH